jgi:hypothetical protein
MPSGEEVHSEKEPDIGVAVSDIVSGTTDNAQYAEGSP